MAPPSPPAPSSACRRGCPCARRGTPAGRPAAKAPPHPWTAACALRAAFDRYRGTTFVVVPAAGGGGSAPSRDPGKPPARPRRGDDGWPGSRSLHSLRFLAVGTLCRCPHRIQCTPVGFDQPPHPGRVLGAEPRDLGRVRLLLVPQRPRQPRHLGRGFRTERRLACPRPLHQRDSVPRRGHDNRVRRWRGNACPEPIGAARPDERGLRGGAWSGCGLCDRGIPIHAAILLRPRPARWVTSGVGPPTGARLRFSRNMRRAPAAWPLAESRPPRRRPRPVRVVAPPRPGRRGSRSGVGGALYAPPPSVERRGIPPVDAVPRLPRTAAGTR